MLDNRGDQRYDVEHNGEIFLQGCQDQAFHCCPKQPVRRAVKLSYTIRELESELEAPLLSGVPMKGLT